MSAAEKMQMDVDASYIWQGLRSNDLDLVRSILRQVEPDDLGRTVGLATTHISNSLDTANLDLVMKKQLRSMRTKLGKIFVETQDFNLKLSKIREMPDSYARYWNECQLYGLPWQHYLVWKSWRDSSDTVR